MTCDKCRFLILKHTSKGPMCFKGYDIKTVVNCKSYELNNPNSFDYGEIEKKVLAQTMSEPLRPKVKEDGHLVIIGTPHGQG